MVKGTIRKMKFLLDENVPNMYKDKLLKSGLKDVKRINDFEKGISDIEVLKIAVKEERTIITIDTDFHEFKREDHYGIISLSGKLNNPIEKMLKALKQIEKDERFKQENLKNIFIRVTNNEFVVGRKVKNKYKEVKCKYKEN